MTYICAGEITRVGGRGVIQANQTTSEEELGSEHSVQCWKS